MTAVDIPSKDHRDLLDIIDSLRSQGFSRYVDLPEIVVCGDQSAGKSSVLEAISGMSFPTKDNLCTRFATELILRRDPMTSIKVSITPGTDRDSDEAKQLKAWQPSVTIGGHGLEAVIDEAKIAMGLSPLKVFGNDILRVELSGPEQPHLTMVDLPGLFRAANKKQLAENVIMVEQMVKRYMKSPRSIILAVVSAKSEAVLQNVTTFAQQYDPKGLRTMGLITKPDTLDSGSESEKQYVELARNNDVELRLGWHVMRNRSYEERNSTLAERDAAEAEFFSQGVWASVSPSSCGARALKGRLSSVLKNQILLQLPSLVDDVEGGIAACKIGLDRLGPSRQTIEQQRRYLMTVSEHFTALATDAVGGIYNSSFFGNTRKPDDYARRLRAVVRKQLGNFAEEMNEDGQHRIIVEVSEEGQTGGRPFIRREDYIKEVKDRMKYSKGCELPGLFNPLIVSELFAQHCQPWEDIVSRNTEHLVDASFKALQEIVNHVAADEVAGQLLEFIEAKVDDLRKGLAEKVEELLNTHLLFHPITNNRQLIENVQVAQQERRRRAVWKKIMETFGRRDFDDPDQIIKVHPGRLVALFVDELEVDMDSYGSSIAVDYMQAYYKVALSRFVDDISVLAVEACLISKLPTLFSPSAVIELDEAEITLYGSESAETSAERARLSEKQRILETGLQGLKRLHKHRDVALTVEREPCAPSDVLASTEDEGTAMGGAATPEEVLKLTSAVTDAPEPPPAAEPEPEPAVMDADTHQDYPLEAPVDHMLSRKKKGKKNRWAEEETIDAWIPQEYS